MDREVNGMDSDGSSKRPIQAADSGRTMSAWTVSP